MTSPGLRSGGKKSAALCVAGLQKRDLWKWETSGRRDVLGSRPLRALPLCERDALALRKILEPHTLDRRHVEEEVLAARRLDESETLVRESLDSSFSHSILQKYLSYSFVANKLSCPAISLCARSLDSSSGRNPRP